MDLIEKENQYWYFSHSLARNTNSTCCWTFISTLDMAHWFKYHSWSYSSHNTCRRSLVCKYHFQMSIFQWLQGNCFSADFSNEIVLNIVHRVMMNLINLVEYHYMVKQMKSQAMIMMIMKWALKIRSIVYPSLFLNIHRNLFNNNNGLHFFISSSSRFLVLFSIRLLLFIYFIFFFFFTFENKKKKKRMGEETCLCVNGGDIIQSSFTSSKWLKRKLRCGWNDNKKHLSCCCSLISNSARIRQYVWLSRTFSSSSFFNWNIADVWFSSNRISSSQKRSKRELNVACKSKKKSIMVTDSLTNVFFLCLTTRET